MMEKIHAAITGVGGYVPDYVLTNEELSNMVDTNDEWITTRTGIKERRILKGEKGTSEMAAKAVAELLTKTNTNPEEVDLIIVATVTPDYVFPATANLVAVKTGCVNAFSFDIGAACSGFIYALSTGTAFIESGRYKKVIVVGADKMSSIVDYTDRTTCIIFGDAAGAVMLEATEEEIGVLDYIHKSDGTGADFLRMKAGGSKHPATHETIEAREHYAYQDGKTVFKFAVVNMADYAEKIMQRNNLTGDDIAWLVPHQANKRIVDATSRRMGVSDDKVMMNIERYGNTTSATIPTLLWNYEKQLKKGDNLILAAFGGGFTWGSLYVKWAYNS
jgi:3-oxoacyl-[acyl-carrier-protein] synthase III